MNKSYALYLALGFILLSGCASRQTTPTASPAPIDTQEPVLATSNDDIIGTWQLGSGTFALYLQFNEAGDYRVAQSDLANLEDGPTILGDFLFDKGLLTLITSEESPLCAGLTGTYEVYLSEEGAINFSLQEDPCTLRAGTNYVGLKKLPR